MSKDIDALQDILTRMDRLETALSLKLDRFTGSEHAMVEWLEALTIEGEELKALKHAFERSLPEKMHDSLKESTNLFMPQLLSKIVEGFQAQTQESTKSCIDDAQQIKKDIDSAISKTEKFLFAQKKDMTWQRLGMTFFFCWGAIVTAISIFYFFPQHEHVTYELDQETARQAIMGKVLVENLAKLTPEQHKFFTKKIEEEFKIKK